MSCPTKPTIGDFAIKLRDWFDEELWGIARCNQGRSAVYYPEIKYVFSGFYTP